MRSRSRRNSRTNLPIASGEPVRSDSALAWRYGFHMMIGFFARRPPAHPRMFAIISSAKHWQAGRLLKAQHARVEVVQRRAIETVHPDEPSTLQFTHSTCARSEQR